jgi:hypothetical protein
VSNHREPVEYIEVSKPDIGEKKKIKLFQGGNGDFYLTVCPYNHNGGETIRLETSGGTSTTNPRLLNATNLMYLALKDTKESKEEFDEQVIKSLFCDMSFEDVMKKTLELRNDSDKTTEDKLLDLQKHLEYLKNNFKIVNK